MIMTTDAKRIKHRTRFWRHDNFPHSSTAIQFRTDAAPYVWMHSNVGWIPIGNSPIDVGDAERFAEEAAVSYELEEAGEHEARVMAGWDGGT